MTAVLCILYETLFS